MGLVNLIVSWIVAARRLLALVAVSGLAGLVVAALVAPMVTGIGVSARDGAEAFTEMPAGLEISPLAERSRILDRDGKTLAVFFEENRVEVPLDKISPEMQNAILAIEDHRFYEHGPLDVQGASRAFVGNVQAGETTSGGSTLTQQYVKLLLLDRAESDAERADVLADAGAQGYFRKLRELRVALSVEQRLTKDEILAGYLNIANFGGPPGRANYGVEAAARHYFSTSAAKLTLTQAAMLAGLVQRPTEYDPVDNPEAAIGRRNTVITRMADLGMITQEEAKEARQADLGLDLKESRSGCVSSWAPWFCDYAVNEVLRMDELGDDPDERMETLRKGGLRIVTTLDRDVQRAADDAVSDRVAPTDSAVGTLAMVEPGTGEIKALSNSREYGPQGDGNSMVNYAVDKAMGNSNGIQAGSAFKPFVLAAALNQGMEPNLEINSPERVDVSGEWFEACWNDQSRVRDADYEPENSTRGGRITMREATEWSTNTYYVQLLQRTGICEPARIAESSGVWKQVPTTTKRQPLDQVPSFVLGSNTVAPLGMAEAFAMFANRGEHCASFAVAEIVDRNGDTIVEKEPECDRVLDTDVADMTNDILRGVIETEGATGSAMRLAGDRPAAGKTGTTNRNVAVWFVGYTPQLSAAAAVADLDPPQTTLSGRNYNGDYVREAFGSTLPGPIWRRAMNEALDGEPHEGFPEP